MGELLKLWCYVLKFSLEEYIAENTKYMCWLLKNSLPLPVNT